MSNLLYPLRRLINDTLSALVFALLYGATGNLILAVGVSVGVGLLQILIEYWRGAAIHVIQWLSLFLVVVLGGLAIFLNDPRVAMLKPTIAYIAVGGVMLKPGWMLPYLPPAALQYGEDIAFAFGYVWSALMFVTAAANLAFAWWGGVGAWTLYVIVFPLASKLVLFAVQYATMRILIGRRIVNNANAQGLDLQN